MDGDALEREGLVTPKAPYSPAVASGDFVMRAEQVAFDVDGSIVGEGIEEQARQVFVNLGRCLGAAGFGFADGIKVTAFPADLAGFEAYNDVYRDYISPQAARTTVQAGHAPGLRIEVEAVARKHS